MIKIIGKIFGFAGSRKKLLIKATIVSFLGAIFSAFQFAALLLVLDAVLAGNKDTSLIWISLGIMLFSVLGKGACMYYSTNAETEAGFFMVAEKRIHIGDRLRYIPMGYFDKNSLGAITAVVTTTLSDVENSAARCLVMLFGGFLNTFALCLMLFISDWRMGLIAIAGIAVYLLATELSAARSKATEPARQQAQETLVEAVLEYIQGMSVVKAFGLEKDNTQTVQKNIDDSCKKALGLEYSVAPFSALRQAVVRIFQVLLAGVGILFFLNGTMELSRCLLMLIASFMIYRELESAGNMSDMLQMLNASMDKANAVDDTPVMDVDGEDLTPEDASVVFEEVEFSYAGKKDGDASKEGRFGEKEPEERKILDKVSLEIKPKTTTAIVGPSGGGKTTLCHLIARFWDVQGGQIRVGGYPVEQYKLDSLMKNISVVFQNVYLFADTIENNIKFGKQDASHEEVVEAAKRACCHDFIMALPEGYDTVVGEGGGNLSGGEKQRISIARALLKNAPIIILDEATASVDPENERELQRAIEALTEDKTIIMIAHRLKTVRHAEQILVLNEGHIVQRGTHRELAAVPGLYQDFLNARKEAIGWKLGRI